jgi:hypothetical protein
MENIERTIALAVIAQQQLRDLFHYLQDDGLAAVTFKSLEATLSTDPLGRFAVRSLRSQWILRRCLAPP